MGVTVETTKAGNGQMYPQPGDNVTMDYTGKLLDGTVRVSSLVEELVGNSLKSPPMHISRFRMIDSFLIHKLTMISHRSIESHYPVYSLAWTFLSPSIFEIFLAEDCCHGWWTRMDQNSI